MIDLELVAVTPQAEDRPPVEGFSGWWDASDHASVQTGIDQTVTEWRDKSGAARHLTQPTQGWRPWTGGHSENGRNVVSTRNQNRYMQGTIPVTAQPWTGFTVAAQTIGDGTQRDAWVMRASTGEGRLYRNTSDDILLYLGSTVNSGRKWERNRAHAVTSVFWGGNSEITVDARYRVASAMNPHQADTGWTVFSFPGPSESWWGWIGEIVIYPRSMTVAEMGLVEQYLTRKWGIR